jgi:hypothetical protein
LKYHFFFFFYLFVYLFLIIFRPPPLLSFLDSHREISPTFKNGLVHYEHFSFSGKPKELVHLPTQKNSLKESTKQLKKAEIKRKEVCFSCAVLIVYVYILFQAKMELWNEQFLQNHSTTRVIFPTFGVPIYFQYYLTNPLKREMKIDVVVKTVNETEIKGR